MLADRIADAVEDRLRQQHQGESTLYRRELGICVGAGRTDVAAVNGVITGCEVKSAAMGSAGCSTTTWTTWPTGWTPCGPRPADESRTFAD